MAKKRFKKLEAALRYCATAADLNNGGTTTVVPPTGSVLEGYQKYKKGELVLTYTRATGSKPGEIMLVQGTPFYKATDRPTLKINVSKRAYESTEAPMTGVKGACNLAAYSDGVEPPNGFMPAQVTVKTPWTGTTDETSKLTGVKYKKPTGTESFTLPVCGGATADWVTTKNAIITAAAGTAKTGVSFKPEKLV